MAQIGKITSLTHLALDGGNIGKGLAHLKPLKSLRYLSLRGNSNYDIDKYLVHLAKLTELEELNLRNTAVGDAGLAHLKGMSKLEKLYVRKNPATREVTNAGMAQLAGLTNIEMTNIGGPDLTDDGLRHLANIKKLNHLTITDGKITDKGLRHLEGLKALSYLNIKSQKDLSPAALERLRRKLPGLAMLSIGEEHGAYGGRQRALNKRSRRSQRDTRNRSRLWRR